MLCLVTCAHRGMPCPKGMNIVFSIKLGRRATRHRPVFNQKFNQSKASVSDVCRCVRVP